MPFAEAPGLRLRYRQWGEHRDGAPLVLIHGAGSSSATFMDLGRRLGAHRRTIAFDLPGHGQSGPMPHAISIDSYRDLTGWLCATVRAAGAVLVGHSMGGAIALASALAWPDKVSALVMLGSGTRLPVAPATLAAIRDHFPQWADLVAATCYAPTTPRDIARRWSRVTVQASREVTLADFEACAAFDVRDRLHALACPTLSITGQDDLMVPGKYAIGRTVLLPQAGHNLHHERPDDILAAMLEFLA